MDPALFSRAELLGADDPAAGEGVSAIPEPETLSSHGPAVVLSMCNQKGGVGKTTSTINLAAALAEYGRRVLVVDLDPQGALSAGLGIPHHQLDLTVYNLLVDNSVSTEEVLVRTRVEGVDLIPANIDLSAAEIQLVNEVGREQALGRALYPVLDRYDFVLVDCQPSLGLLTVNALACSDGVLIPMECEYFSLRGLALLTDTIDKVRDRINPRLHLTGILITMFDRRTVHARDVLSRVVEVFGDKVFDTLVTRTVRFPETTVAGEPITAKLTNAPGNGAAIGGLKVTTENAWFAARPSGTEDVYKIYAESFKGEEHLKQVQQEAKALVDSVIG